MSKAYNKIKTKTDFKRYNVTVISVFISIAALYHHLRDYERLNRIAHELKRLHAKYNVYNRYYYVNIFLAFAYYEKEELEKSRDSFMDGIHSALLFKSASELKISNRYFEQFKEIVEDAKRSYLKSADSNRYRKFK